MPGHLSQGRFFNSIKARDRVLTRCHPIRVQIIKKPKSSFNPFCRQEGIVIDIKKGNCIWIKLDGKGKILKLPFDHVLVIPSTPLL